MKPSKNSGHKLKSHFVPQLAMRDEIAGGWCLVETPIVLAKDPEGKAFKECECHCQWNPKDHELVLTRTLELIRTTISALEDQSCNAAVPSMFAQGTGDVPAPQSQPGEAKAAEKTDPTQQSHPKSEVDGGLAALAGVVDLMDSSEVSSVQPHKRPRVVVLPAGSGADGDSKCGARDSVGAVDGSQSDPMAKDLDLPIPAPISNVVRRVESNLADLSGIVRELSASSTLHWNRHREVLRASFPDL